MRTAGVPNRRSLPVRLLLALAALAAWAFVFGVLVAPAAAGSSWPALLFDRSCALLCHQNPARTLVGPWGAMAVCARCFGLYLGAALALTGAAVIGRASAPSRWWLLVLLPTGIDALFHLFFGGGLESLPRSLVSLPAGAVLGWLLAHALDDLARMLRAGRRPERRKALAAAGAVEECG